MVRKINEKHTCEKQQNGDKCEGVLENDRWLAVPVGLAVK